MNVSLLAPSNSYSVPAFVERGYYIDIEFTCQGCGSQEVWTATQQKWWYEVAKGYEYSTAKLCRNCRRKAREQKAQTRAASLAGLVRKQAQRAKK